MVLSRLTVTLEEALWVDASRVGIGHGRPSSDRRRIVEQGAGTDQLLVQLATLNRLHRFNDTNDRRIDFHVSTASFRCLLWDWIALEQ